MDLCALEELAAQLRSYIIDVVSVRQGHLGSNLGVVELAVALHYVFDTPDEPLVWDVGHQAYAHKILTGRRDAFLHLREYGGISGFPRRDESPYDAFGTGHSSTSVSAVLGMALADKARGIRKNHIAVIGDASIASGMALEALNHAAGAADADMLVVLNDNAMGIDPASGALSRHFKTLLEDRAQDNIFRAMGVKYFKISDGHDIKELVGTLSEIKNVPGVKLLHVPTVKGKGFEAAEKEQILYHYPGVFDRATGQVTRNASLRYQDVAGRELLEVARADSAVSVSYTHLDVYKRQGYVYPFERGVRYGRCREVPVIREITHQYETCVGRGLVVAFDSKGKFVFDRRFFLYGQRYDGLSGFQTLYVSLVVDGCHIGFGTGKFERVFFRDVRRCDFRCKPRLFVFENRGRFVPDSYSAYLHGRRGWISF